uniref:Peptidase A1 domain-containing protein n=1 Tax=Strongyloides venezuelensis TaxID=75913 RepID=A0A0K0F109_STRVS
MKERVKSVRRRLIREGKLEEFLKELTNTTDEPKSQNETEYYGREKKKVIVQYLYSYFDVQYLENISKGIRSQNFRVFLDTGLSNFWVVDKACLKNGGKNNPCAGKSAFILKRSLTYKNKHRKFSVTYVTDYAKGNIDEDTLQILGRKRTRIRMKKIEFGQASTLSPTAAQSPFEGIMGLAFRPIANDDMTPPLISAMHRKLLAKPLFSVHLRQIRGALSIYGGKFTYGAINKDHCGPVIGYQKLSHASYWQFTVRSVSINKLKYNHGLEAIADTGNPFIEAPPATVERIANILKDQVIQQIGLYFVDCSVKNNGLNIKLFKLNIKIKKNIFCQNMEIFVDLIYSHMFSGGYSPAFSFGDPFHTSNCVICDIGNKRIGFARPKR